MVDLFSTSFIDRVKEQRIKIREADVVYLKIKFGNFTAFYAYRARFEITKNFATIEEIMASKLLYGEKCIIIPEKDLGYIMGMSTLDTLKVNEYILSALKDEYDINIIYSEEDLKGVDI